MAANVENKTLLAERGGRWPCLVFTDCTATAPRILEGVDLRLTLISVLANGMRTECGPRNVVDAEGTGVKSSAADRAPQKPRIARQAIANSATSVESRRVFS